MNVIRSSFLRDFWALFKPYWFSKEKTTALLLLFAIVGLTLGMVYMNVQINQWQNLFFNSLQDKNKPEFYSLILRFSMLAGLWIIMAVYSPYLTQMLQIRWRRWLTDKYLKDWLADQTYYPMQLKGKETDNPDQRVAEDLKIFVNQTLGLSIGLLNAVVTLVSFVGVLWALSGPLSFPLNGYEIVIPGYMVWVAIVYAALGNWLANKIGKPLIDLNFNQQRFEADFRYSLVRFRENMEGVALYRGEEDEMRAFDGRFQSIFANWWAIMKRQKQLTWFSAGYGQLAVIFPFVVAAPRFFSGAIPLGGLMQTASAFGYVRESLSWFINVYPSFAEWKATVDRLIGFHKLIEAAKQDQRLNSGVELLAGPDGTLRFDQLELALPTGQTLVSSANLHIAHGSRVLLQGPSGSGKSTLIRAIAGIWPFGKGQIRQPAGFDVLFLPQRPYFPLGTLRESVCYPARVDTFTDTELEEALFAVGLPHLVSQLGQSANWSAQLSGGEQQRVAFARALLIRPAWLFLDEATSSLDNASQMRLYELLTQRLTDTTIVSIAHRSELAGFHPLRLELRVGRGGAHDLAWLNPQPV
ncbi:MAG TPA: ABC transporter ATP-binding protein/permease [Burkholderiales bacterium]|nr:ABC transporter ATP-binding protein/permease [Burkholderiales bacterium]